MTLDQRLVLVTGASGEVGAAYLRHFVQQPGVRCVGIHRSELSDCVQGVEYVRADLREQQSISSALAGVSFASVREIALIHAVGMFKWEETGTPAIDVNADGVDDEVYASNVDTLYSILSSVLEKRQQLKVIPQLTVVAFGSLSDRYAVPYWQSYTKAKNVLRAELRRRTELVPSFRALMINLPTVATSTENNLRPCADTTYWMRPAAVVAGTVALIYNPPHSYTEIDRYQESPHFREGYYADHVAIYAAWKTGMGDSRV